jgi:hypothetical protein
MNEIIFNQHQSSANNDTKNLAGRLKKQVAAGERDKRYIMGSWRHSLATRTANGSSAPHAQLTASSF